MRVIAALAMVSLVAGVAWFAIGPGAGPPIGSCADTTAPAAQAPDPAPLGAIAWRGETILDEADDFGEDLLLDVEAFDGRFVAVGRRSDGPRLHAFLLRSPDGLEWAEDPDDAARFADTELTHLAVVDGRLFAVGSTSIDDRGGTRAAVWFSDDGVEWQSAAGPFDARRAGPLAGTGDGLLMFGSEADSGDTVAWWSADGSSWSLQPLELPVSSSDARVAALSADAGGWRGVGAISRGPDSALAAVVWRSADGRSWSCKVLDSAGFSRVDAIDLHVSGDRALTVGIASRGCGIGASCPGFGITWAARGDEWATARTGSHGEPASGAVYASGGAGFLAVRGGAAWSSADGAHWAQLDQLAGLTSVGAVAAVAVDGARVVAVGSVNDGSSTDAWVASGEVSP